MVWCVVGEQKGRPKRRARPVDEERKVRSEDPREVAMLRRDRIRGSVGYGKVMCKPGEDQKWAVWQ